ncbi:MAG: hypothetical protein ACI90V_008304 [Bacillariaceae sp.]|jgi:hypothetical protein
MLWGRGYRSLADILRYEAAPEWRAYDRFVLEQNRLASARLRALKVEFPFCNIVLTSRDDRALRIDLDHQGHPIIGNCP